MFRAAQALMLVVGAIALPLAASQGGYGDFRDVCGDQPLQFDVLRSRTDLSIFVDLLDLINSTQLDPAQPFTVLAPTNAAIEALGLPDLSSIDSGTVQLISGVLADHAFPGEFFSTDLADGMTFQTLFDLTFELPPSLAVEIGTDGSVVFTLGDLGNSATVIEADIDSCGGPIHIIDTVLIRAPPE